MGSVFDLCVRILMKIANLTGLTYETVNVLIFVVLLPIGLGALVARTVWLENRLAQEGLAQRVTLPALQILFWATVLVLAVALL